MFLSGADIVEHMPGVLMRAGKYVPTITDIKQWGSVAKNVCSRGANSN